MGRKRPERTERRARERDARQTVRDREKLALLLPGGTAEHPIEVSSAAVIEGRVRAMPCVQCEGEYDVKDRRSAGPGQRAVTSSAGSAGCRARCGFRIVIDEPN